MARKVTRLLVEAIGRGLQELMDENAITEIRVYKSFDQWHVTMNLDIGHSVKCMMPAEEGPVHNSMIAVLEKSGVWTKIPGEEKTIMIDGIHDLRRDL
jgi:hypothetical protein